VGKGELAMAEQQNPALPDGTDAVIEGASGRSDGETATVEDTALATEQEISAPKGDAERPVVGSGNPSDGGSGPARGDNQSLADRFRSGREQIATQAGDRARGIVSQGLERTAEALANVSKMVGDTAGGIEERLGPEYGDYARRAAGAIENVANTIAEKDPDELIEDTRNFVRNSPGIALAGAAVVGFVVARLIKSGMAKDEDEDA
jgi:ElaB/YqjD/DUF883 family membrane-anchored ribosome-binding protein